MDRPLERKYNMKLGGIKQKGRGEFVDGEKASNITCPCPPLVPPQPVRPSPRTGRKRRLPGGGRGGERLPLVGAGWWAGGNAANASILAGPPSTAS